jgi:hypothetical protein
LGVPTPPRSVGLLMGVLSSFPEMFDMAAERAQREFGLISLKSDLYDFNFTSYYDAEMGVPIRRQFLFFRDLIDPGALADAKLITNRLESEFAGSGVFSVARPVNLDPGYVTESKLVLATTKDYSHRIYLRDGIYAEVTLLFRKGRCEPLPWTYPDFRSPSYHSFFLQTRDAYHKCRMAETQARSSG